MKEVIEKIKLCVECELCKTRINTVPGEGPIDSRIMIVGEGPGELNDIYGRPFIGKGGAILDACLQESNLEREKLYLTNIIKCRMPHNATPTGKIIDKCSTYIQQQIDIIKPKVIICLGLAASKFFLNDKTVKLVDLIDNTYNYKDSVLICTYHPSSIRYNKNAKKLIIQTLSLAKKIAFQGNEQ